MICAYNVSCSFRQQKSCGTIINFMADFIAQSNKFYISGAFDLFEQFFEFAVDSCENNRHFKKCFKLM